MTMSLITFEKPEILPCQTLIKDKLWNQESLLYVQEGCTKLYTCIWSTRSVLSHMEKYCLLKDKRKYGSKICVPDMLENCINIWREDGGKKKIKLNPNPHSDQLQQGNKYLYEKQQLEIVKSRTYCRQKQRSQKCNRPRWKWQENMFYKNQHMEWDCFSVCREPHY